MSAALFRRAAEEARAEWGDATSARLYPKSTRIHLALADLFDVAAEDWPAGVRLMTPVERHLRILARAYVGEPS